MSKRGRVCRAARHSTWSPHLWELHLPLPTSLINTSLAVNWKWLAASKNISFLSKYSHWFFLFSGDEAAFGSARVFLTSSSSVSCSIGRGGRDFRREVRTGWSETIDMIESFKPWAEPYLESARATLNLVLVPSCRIPKDSSNLSSAPSDPILE